MKTLKITLENKEDIMLVEVPMDSHTYYINSVGGIRYSQPNPKRSSEFIKYHDISTAISPDESKVYFTKLGFEILGCYLPKSGEIDFEVKEEWVEKHKNMLYRDYDYEETPKDAQAIVKVFGEESHVKSFISLLQSETAKAWKYKENPHGLERPHSKEERFFAMGLDFYEWILEQWKQAEAQVMPSKLLVIKIKK